MLKAVVDVAVVVLDVVDVTVCGEAAVEEMGVVLDEAGVLADDGAAVVLLERADVDAVEVDDVAVVTVCGVEMPS